MSDFSQMPMNDNSQDEERRRSRQSAWKNWGPYVSNRQWGTVREDYSPNGDAWNYTGYFDAINHPYRWGEDGIGGICDRQQLLCFAPAFWNGQDSCLKERLFGLSNPQGNHGEDIKEILFYLDNVPSHSYMKMLYKYPTVAFPYQDLILTNGRRTRQDPEYEILDTGIFQQGKYFDIEIAYAKTSEEDILMEITATNRSLETAELYILPQLWFRNTWAWGYDDYQPELYKVDELTVGIRHRDLSQKYLYFEENEGLIFCHNDDHHTAPELEETLHKGRVNELLTSHKLMGPGETVGTKVAGWKKFRIAGGDTVKMRLRLCAESQESPFAQFNEIFSLRQKEAEDYYQNLQNAIPSPEEKQVQRQAFAGLLWNKQFYHYVVSQWLHGDPHFPVYRENPAHVRNRDWENIYNRDIISMPDKWEYPWYATWDLAFHTIPLALIDADFAKEQLLLFTREWYQHPNGELPAYEWNFSDVNPPVHAWAVFRVFKIDERENGQPDLPFLEKTFQKLLLTFTWWVNRKDASGNNLFGGGFLGLDNIGAFDRNMRLPEGDHLEQADGTSWMAMFSLNMMRIAMELALYNPVYEDMCIKFFEHFLSIAKAMENLGDGLWDEEDGFFYDLLKLKNGGTQRLKLRSIVGLIPMFAVEVVEHDMLQRLPRFRERLQWVLDNKPELAQLVSHWEVEGKGRKHLMSILRKTRLTRILSRMLDEGEFLSPYGIRSLSKVYDEKPFILSAHGNRYTVRYLPGESDSDMFGGNSNWRGPIWFPLNFLIVESLQRFNHYYGDALLVKINGEGEEMNLAEVAKEISARLKSLLLPDDQGRRPVNGSEPLLDQDPHFSPFINFHEYFNAETGKGLGAGQQTGWTATVAKLIQPPMK